MLRYSIGRLLDSIHCGIPCHKGLVSPMFKILKILDDSNVPYMRRNLVVLKMLLYPQKQVDLYNFDMPVFMKGMDCWRNV